jgi:hypothetical protein
MNENVIQITHSRCRKCNGESGMGVPSKEKLIGERACCGRLHPLSILHLLDTGNKG